MCGIFGLMLDKDAGFSPTFTKKALTTIALLSESRGKDSSGLVFRNNESQEFRVLKGPVSIRYLLGRKEVSEQIDQAIRPSNGAHHPFAGMGHSRLVTNGSQIQNLNNQPVIKDGIIAIHNGVIVNHRELWERHSDIQRSYEIDTEIILSLFRKHLSQGWQISTALSRTIQSLFGTVATALFMEESSTLALATNNGSLYVLTDRARLFAFGSEEYFLKELSKRMALDSEKGFEILQVTPGSGFVLDLDNFDLQDFSFSDEPMAGNHNSGQSLVFEIRTSGVSDSRPEKELILDPAKIAAQPQSSAKSKLLEHNIDRILALRRCTRCVLPETFPFIEFDTEGVCNYCHNYKLKNQPKPLEDLMKMVEPYRRNDKAHDCIVPYSGGRDSTHTLHIVKNVLGLNPVAFTYDWGMVNDLARRNIARVCGKLKVENILVSADIAWKRENIRRNIVAWLRRPHLGIVPLFMAGDKFFFHYCAQIKKQTGIRLNIWGINPLENTDFKVGFLRVPPDHDKERIYSLSLTRKLRLFAEMGKNIVANPAYLNRSLRDSIGSFVSRSMVKHTDYYHMYDFYRWDEQEIESLVLDEYRWEKAIDTDTTWRIGDGTAPFYNYIYYTVAGFSEYDTFRSNQIREGVMSREQALSLVDQENRPRYPSIKWYTDIVHLDFESTIKRINAIPKLYA